MGTVYTPMNPPPEKPQTRAPVVTFARRDVGPPSNVYVLADDLLIVQAVASPSTSSVNISYRLLLADGTIEPGVIQFDVPGDGAVHTFTQQLAEGFILTAQVTRTVGRPPVSPTFVQVGLARPGGAAPIPYNWFLAGYVFVNQALGFPHSGVRSPIDGAGTIVTFNGSAPLVGQETSFAVPAGTRLRPICVRFSLTTDAVAGNRQVTLTVISGGITVFGTNSGTPQPPSTTWDYRVAAFSGGAVSFGTLPEISMPEEMILSPGFSLQTSTAGKDAGDQYGGILLWCEQWIAQF